MSITILLAAAGISIACSLLVSLFLSTPLYQLLGDLCGTDQRARFWHRYTSLMMLLVPLLSAYCSARYSRSPPLASSWRGLFEKCRRDYQINEELLRKQWLPKHFLVMVRDDRSGEEPHSINRLQSRPNSQPEWAASSAPSTRS